MGRFDEMVDHMKEVAGFPEELSVEERNLLSVAYKNVIGSRRASWRVISSIEQKSDSEKTALITNYKRKIETELENICDDILQIIGDVLIPNSVGDEGKVFYYKMKGDYHRYLAEFQAPDRRKESSSSALESYQQASQTGQHKGDSTSLQRECSARARSGKSIHASRPFREMIARPKISRNEWKTAEKGAFEVGNFALFCCPAVDVVVVEVGDHRPPREAQEQAPLRAGDGGRPL